MIDQRQMFEIGQTVEFDPKGYECLDLSQPELEGFREFIELLPGKLFRVVERDEDMMGPYYRLECITDSEFDTADYHFTYNHHQLLRAAKE